MSRADQAHLSIALDAIRVCVNYNPKFGQGANGKGRTFDGFREFYHRNLFYGWFELDNSLTHIAQKPAGGMTSVYRRAREWGNGLRRISDSRLARRATLK